MSLSAFWFAGRPVDITSFTSFCGWSVEIGSSWKEAFQTRMALSGSMMKGASSAELYLARIMNPHAGHRLRVELFDIGDVADSTTTIELLQPNGASGSWACATTKLSGGGQVPIGNDCTLSGIDRAGWNGAAARFVVDIPPDYSCTATLETDCWMKVRIAFGSDAVATDTSTWSATIDGDPIRLKN